MQFMLLHNLRKYMKKSAVRFALVGVLNTSLGLGLILFCQFSLGLSALLSNASGYSVGLCLSYLLNRSFSFGSKRPHSASVVPFIMVAATSYLLNLAALRFFEYHEGLAPWPLAHAMCMIIYSASFFFLSRRFVFNDVKAKTGEMSDA